MMPFIFVWFYCLLGLVLGSFFNVCIYRIPLHQSVVGGRSYCPHCGQSLHFWDMIPLLSFALLRGRCRFCKKAISLRYPLVEALSGLLWVLCLYTFGVGPLSLLWGVVSSLLLCVAFLDGLTGEIPDFIPLVLLGAGILCCLWPMPPLLFSRLLGAVAISLPMSLLACTLNAFGGGDIKLMAAAGFLLGWQGILLGFFIACITCAIWALVLRIMGKITFAARIPFGPFLAVGIGVAGLWGQSILTWYFALL